MHITLTLDAEFVRTMPLTGGKPWWGSYVELTQSLWS